MPSSLRLPSRVHEQIQGARNRLARTNVLVGLDGFVDTILHVVKTRESATKYTRLERMTEFAERIGAAAGLSANLELVTQMVKLGGNGPIMASALGNWHSRSPTSGISARLRFTRFFADFAPARKGALDCRTGLHGRVEFDDGKLMFGKHESLGQVNCWANLLRHLPEADLLRIFSDCSL